MYQFLMPITTSIYNKTAQPYPHNHIPCNKLVKMATHGNNTDRKDRNAQWVLSKDIPTDILVQVGEANFPLHKFMLLAKSNHIRRLIIESEEPDLGRIDLSDIPGGAEIFEKAARFCYGMNFEITVNNVAALHCAAEYLEMTDQCCDGNLATRTYAFLQQVALTSLSGAVTVLKSCEDLLPVAEQLNIVQQCVEVAGVEACNEANSPSCSPPNWWEEELSTVHITFFQRIIDSMKSHGTKALAIAGAITTYAKRALPTNLVNEQHSVNAVKPRISGDFSSSTSRIQQRELLESIVALFPAESHQQAVFPISFLCNLLRSAIALETSDDCKKQLEKRISAVLDQVTADDLLLLSYATFGRERLCDMESVRRIVIGFVAKERSVSVFGSGDYNEAPSPAMVTVAKTIDVYLSEIAMAAELSIPKFTGIANLVPKNARDVDDNLYRAIDIYLEVHPDLDEIEREKVCNPMDPLKLSAKARAHASQNKKLPLKIVLHTLYYDELQARSDIDGRNTPGAQSMRLQVHADVALAKENETLKSEVLRMKAYISNIEKQVGTPSPKLKRLKKPTFFSSMSKTLGKLNPFKQGSKDTSNIKDEVDHNKPRRRRFSMS